MDFSKILSEISVPSGTCEYWDVRIESVQKTEIRYEDFELISCSKKPSLGAFVRVYQAGKWFYLSTTELNSLSSQICEVAAKASRITNDQESAYRPYNQQSSSNHFRKSSDTRFDKISIEEKKKTCSQYFSVLQAQEKLSGIKVGYSDEYKEKFFLSSTGVEFSYDFNQAGVSFSYTATEGDDSFSDKFQLYGENLNDLQNKESELEKSLKESLLFISAKTITAGDYPVVMSSTVVGVFAHESFGHKSEADFMLGDEEAKEIWKIGSKVGNECLSIVDYGAEHGSSGYCPIDDEGFPTQKTYLIKNGLLTGRLHSQQTSQVLDEAPTGNGRAMNFEFEPIVRMTNTYVEAGDTTFDELISKVELGLFVKDFKHGSGLSTFTIAPLKSYMIRDGKIAEPVKVSVISGSIFDTLNKIEGCSSSVEMFSSAFGGCGKMEQFPLPVGFGGSNVLVSEMVVS